MKPLYLPSVYQMHEEHYAGKLNIEKTNLLLKKTEVISLKKLCDILSINIPYPVVGSLMRTCVTAPTSLPFWMMGEPDTSVVK